MTKLPCEYLYPENLLVPSDITSDGKRFTWHPSEIGTFRLSSAKHVKFYALEVWKNGGHVSIADGSGRVIFKQPSLFTGSFQMDGGLSDGLIIRLGAASGVIPSVTVSWMATDG